MPVLQIRMLEDLHAWIKSKGGSPFAREILTRAMLADNGKQPEQTPAGPAAPPASAEEACPRWMHHRTGEFCKTCGRVP